MALVAHLANAPSARAQWEVRESSIALLNSLTQSDIDRASAAVAAGFEDTFGTYRLCLQFVADQEPCSVGL